MLPGNGAELAASQQPEQPRKRGQGRTHPRDGVSVVTDAGKTGHWARECPYSNNEPMYERGIVGEQLCGEEAYIRTITNGTGMYALLDSG